MTIKNHQFTSNVHYLDDTFKLFIQEEEMFPNSNYHSVQHIHPEIEMMLITEGYLYYHINGEDIKVTKDQMIFVNTNQMHASHLKESKYCKFIVLLVHPSIFVSSAFIFANYAKPILDNQKLDYMIFDHHKELNHLFKTMLSNERSHSTAYQLSLIADAYNVLRYLYEKVDAEIKETTSDNLEELTILNKMTSFIYKNYSEKISLQDIADVGNVSLSKCSRMFNHYMHHSPIDFLNIHRLEVASNLLRSTNNSISDISSSCGFEQQSYFNRMFKKVYGCTPSNYRKNPVDQFVH